MNDKNPNGQNVPNRPISENPQNNSNGPEKIKLPDGTFGVYMGETGKAQTENIRRRRTVSRQSGSAAQQGRPAGAQQGGSTAQQGRQRTYSGGRYALSEEERRAIERRHAYDRAKRKAAAEGRMNKSRKNIEAEPTISEGIVKYISYYSRSIWDRIYMGWMGISIDLDTIIKVLIIAGMILLFAMLQTTVFSRFALFGATPDLMLGLVIAVGSTEGERWGSATGLASAFLIEALGGGGLTLLPLLYVPVGCAVGILSTGYLRDTALIRVIYTAAAGVLRAVFTAIYVFAAYKKVDVGLMIGSILIPEYFSTAIMGILPHVTEWFALKAFHKSREDRISS